MLVEPQAKNVPTRMTAIQLHPQRDRSNVFYWVNANKAGHDRWIKGVENSVIFVSITLKYLKTKKNGQTLQYPFTVKLTDKMKP